MKKEKQRLDFVLCIRNDGSDDLEPRKIYPVLPDRTASLEGYVRVVDESGEDYLYPAEYFVAVRLPEAIARELASPSKRAVAPATVAVSVRGEAMPSVPVSPSARGTGIVEVSAEAPRLIQESLRGQVRNKRRLPRCSPAGRA